MALLGEFKHIAKDRHQVHERVECGYSSFEADGRRYVQLDTYGSTGRQIPGKTSQSLQLDMEAAKTLQALIASTFPSLR